MASTETAPRVGERLMMSATPDHLHWFDSGTGRRMAS
jgi:hypothetical protein